jgi:peptidyl-prolyl cis-trans isomerase C
LPYSRPAFILALALLAGCGTKDSGRKAVARIDDRTLTLEDVRARLDSSRGVTSAQVGEFARRWINDEILYREAVRRGLDNKPAVQAQLEEARRQLVINALLQDEIYTANSVESTPDELAQYFAAHNKEFTLPTDVALVSFLMFADRDVANSFRTVVLKGTPWSQAVRQAMADPQQSLLMLAKTDSAYFSQSTLLPADLWRVVSASTKPEPSFPVHTNEGFYILIVWKFSRQGQSADLAYVEPEIRSRLTIDHRRRALEGLIERLRSGHAVEMMVSDQADTSSNNVVR